MILLPDEQWIDIQRYCPDYWADIPATDFFCPPNAVAIILQQYQQRGVRKAQARFRCNGSTDDGKPFYENAPVVEADAANWKQWIIALDQNKLFEGWLPVGNDPPDKIYVTGWITDDDAEMVTNAVAIESWRSEWVNNSTWHVLDVSAVAPDAAGFIMSIWNGHWSTGNMALVPDGASAEGKELRRNTKYNVSYSGRFIVAGDTGTMEFVSYDPHPNIAVLYHGRLKGTSGVSGVGSKGFKIPTPGDQNLGFVNISYAAGGVPADAVALCIDNPQGNASGALTGFDTPIQRRVFAERYCSSYLNHPVSQVLLTPYERSLDEIAMYGKWNSSVVHTVFLAGGQESVPPTPPSYNPRTNYTGDSVNWNAASGWSNADPAGFTVDQLPAGLSMTSAGLVTGTTQSAGSTEVTIYNDGIIIEGGGTKIDRPDPTCLFYDPCKQFDNVLTIPAQQGAYEDPALWTGDMVPVRYLGGAFQTQDGAGAQGYCACVPVFTHPTADVTACFAWADDIDNAAIPSGTFYLYLRFSEPSAGADNGYCLQITFTDSRTYDGFVYRVDNNSYINIFNIPKGTFTYKANERIRFEVVGQTVKGWVKKTIGGGETQFCNILDSAGSGTGADGRYKRVAMVWDLQSGGDHLVRTKNFGVWLGGEFVDFEPAAPATENPPSLQAGSSFMWGVIARPVAPTYSDRLDANGSAVNFDAGALWTDPDPTGFSALGLPPGLTCSSTGIVSGTPTTNGTYSTTIRNTTTISTIAAAPFSWQIATQATPPTYSPRHDYLSTSIDIDATNGWTNADPTGYSATGLPTGVSISNDGRIAGTLNGLGTYNPVISNTTVLGKVNAAPFQWTTYIRQVAPTYATQNVFQNDSVNFNAAIGWANPNGTGFSATGLPAGLSISNTGIITGTPTTVAGYSVVVRNTNPAGEVAADPWTWNIIQKSVAPSYTPQANYVGDVVSFNAAAGWTTGYPNGFSASNLPPGLSINAAGLITGTISGAFSGTTTVTNTTPAGDINGALPWTAVAKPVAPSYSDRNDIRNQPVNVDLAAGWTDANPTGFSASNLPAGLSMNSAGVVSGTPTTVYTTRSVTVRNATAVDTQSAAPFNWAIRNVPSAPSYADITGYAGDAVVKDLSVGWSNAASNGFTVDQLPAGLTMSNVGLVTGTPSAAATTAVTVTNTSGSDVVDASPFDWKIILKPVAPTYDARQGRVGTAENFDAATGWTNPVANGFSATGLPTGLSISAVGVITGTPTTVGTFYPVIRNTTELGTISAASFAWGIDPAPVPPTPPTYLDQTDFQDMPVSKNVATGWVNADPDGFTVDQLPVGLSMSPQGRVTGTPTVLGVTTVTISNTNEAGTVAASPAQWHIVEKPVEESTVVNPNRLSVTISVSI